MQLHIKSYILLLDNPQVISMLYIVLLNNQPII